MLLPLGMKVHSEVHLLWCSNSRSAVTMEQVSVNSSSCCELKESHRGSELSHCSSQLDSTILGHNLLLVWREKNGLVLGPFCR